MEKWLLILLGLLALTLALYFIGIFPYPFGILLLITAIVIRLSSLK